MISYTKHIPTVEEYGTFWQNFKNKNEIAALLSSVDDQNVNLSDYNKYLDKTLSLSNAEAYFNLEFELKPLETMQFDITDYKLKFYDSLILDIESLTNTIDLDFINNQLNDYANKTIYDYTLSLSGEKFATTAITPIIYTTLNTAISTDITVGSLINMLDVTNLAYTGVLYTSFGVAINYHKINNTTLQVLKISHARQIVGLIYDGVNYYIDQPQLLSVQGKLTSQDLNTILTYTGINYSTGLLSGVSIVNPPTYNPWDIYNYSFNPLTEILSLYYVLDSEQNWFLKNKKTKNQEFIDFWASMFSTDYQLLLNHYDIYQIITIFTKFIELRKKGFNLEILQDFINLAFGVSSSFQDDQVADITGPTLTMESGITYTEIADFNTSAWNVSVGQYVTRFQLLTNIDDQLLLADKYSDSSFNQGCLFGNEIVSLQPLYFNSNYMTVFKLSFVEELLSNLISRHNLLSLDTQVYQDILYERRLTNANLANTNFTANLNLNICFAIDAPSGGADFSIITPAAKGIKAEIITAGTVLRISLISDLTVTYDFLFNGTTSNKIYVNLVYRTFNNELQIYINGMLQSTLKSGVTVDLPTGIPLYTKGLVHTINGTSAAAKLKYIHVSKTPILDHSVILKYRDFFIDYYSFTAANFTSLLCQSTIDFKDSLKEKIYINEYDSDEIKSFWNDSLTRRNGVGFTTSVNKPRSEYRPFNDSGVFTTSRTYGVLFRLPAASTWITAFATSQFIISYYGIDNTLYRYALKYSAANTIELEYFIGPTLTSSVTRTITANYTTLYFILNHTGAAIVNKIGSQVDSSVSAAVAATQHIKNLSFANNDVTRVITAFYDSDPIITTEITDVDLKEFISHWDLK